MSKKLYYGLGVFVIAVVIVMATVPAKAESVNSLLIRKLLIRKLLGSKPAVIQPPKLEHKKEYLDIVKDPWRAEFWTNTACLDGLGSPTSQGKLSSPSGYRTVAGANYNISAKYSPYQINYGSDFTNDDKSDNQIFAVADAEIVNLGENRITGGGLSVTYKYQRGSETCYADNNHLSSTERLKPGDTVKKGQTIGWMGTTGNVTGKHLDIALYTYEHKGKHLPWSEFKNLKEAGNNYQFIDTFSIWNDGQPKFQPKRSLKNKAGNIKLSDTVLSPIKEAIKAGIINKSEASMILSLYPIESYGSGDWSAIGSDTGNGRRALGLTQIMNYPEFGNSKTKAGLPNLTESEFLSDPISQIKVIKALMVSKVGTINQDYNPDLAVKLASRWLGFGCDMHGTCTSFYAGLSKTNYETSYQDIL